MTSLLIRHSRSDESTAYSIQPNRDISPVLARIFHHAVGRAGLQPRRYRAILIISESRAPRSLRPQAARGAGRTEGGRRGFGGAEQAAEKRLPADNHPGARRATPPESGGELAKELPSSDEEGWRPERRGGADKGIKWWC